MKINCICMNCKNNYEYNFKEKSQICQDCFQKTLNDYGKNIKFHIDKLEHLHGKIELTLEKRKKKTYQFKQLTYFLLFNTPILFYVTIRYGFSMEVIYLIGVIIFTMSYEWSIWCADRL